MDNGTFRKIRTSTCYGRTSLGQQTPESSSKNRSSKGADSEQGKLSVDSEAKPQTMPTLRKQSKHVMEQPCMASSEYQKDQDLRIKLTEPMVDVACARVEERGRHVEEMKECAELRQQHSIRQDDLDRVYHDILKLKADVKYSVTAQRS